MVKGHLLYLLVPAGSDLYAAARYGDVFHSPDNGSSWTIWNIGTTTNVVAVAATNSRIFAGTNGEGVFVSSDSGSTWTTMNIGLADSSVRSFKVSGSRIFVSTLGGVFEANVNGNSWTTLNAGLDHPIVYELVTSGSTLFAATAHGGVYRYDNLISSRNVPQPSLDYVLYPNPFSTSTTLSFNGQPLDNLVLEIYSVSGQLIKQVPINTDPFILNREGLNRGMYLYQIKEKGHPIAWGKLLTE